MSEPSDFDLVSATKPISMLVRPVANTHIHYQRLEINKLAELLHPEEVRIPAVSVYFGLGYLLHGRFDRHGFHVVPCHIYLIPVSYNLKDKEDFGYSASSVVFKGASENSQKEGRQLDAGGTNMNDKSDKSKREKEGSATRSTDSSEGPQRRNTVASIPED